ncbi:MAG: FAD-dependent oxidoreductase [Rhizobiaceae bacterium]|nr:FAD-dependent oxidoreductase [Rhizobiaceae bacterium]
MVTADRKDGFDCDVIVVGGGPVGLGLAIDLAQRGNSVQVIERSTQVHDIPKGQNLTQRSGEHFRSWNVLGEIEAASPIPREFGNAGMVAFGTLLGDYHYDWFKRGAVGAYYFAQNQRLPQYEAERVLRTRAAELPGIVMHYGCKAIAAEQSDEGVKIFYTSEEDDADHSLTAPYAVGCDGSRSAVRKAASIEQNVDPHHRKMALLVFNSKQLHDLLERFPGKSIYNILNPELDGYWQFLGRVDLDGTWFYHAPVPLDTTRENFDFAAYLHRAIGAEFEIDFLHIGFWDLRITHAKTYRNGRIFIAGDAAHSHPPYGGYGINTGFEDVRNLSWKLTAILQGWGGEHLLTSYDAERRPVFGSTSSDFIARMIEDDRVFIEAYSPDRNLQAFEQAWQTRAEGGNADVTQFLPHYEGSPIILGSAGQPGARGVHKVDARPGHHLAPVELSGNRDLFEELGQGFCLIALDGDAAVVSQFVAAAEQLGIPLSTVEDTQADGREDYRARYILVRPDHFIAWVGDIAPDNPADILSRSIGR